MHETTLPFDPHSDNLFILGAWLSYERSRSGYSLRGLARGANVAPSLISAIENQKTKPHLDTLKSLFESMDYAFVLDETYLSSVHENINALYYAIYNQNTDATKNLYDALKPQFEDLKYSPLTIDLILAEAFAHIHIEKKPVSDAFLALKHHLKYLSVVQQQRYYINLGYYALGLNDKASAQAAFENLINCHRESRAHAVGLTLLAQLASEAFHPIQAIEYAEEASKLHARFSNLFRKVEADFLAIKSHIELKRLNSALSIIHNLSYVLVESNQRYWPALQSFKAYLHYRQGLFSKAADILEGLDERDFFQEILLAQSYVYLQEKEAAIQTFKKLSSYETGEESLDSSHVVALFLAQYEWDYPALKPSIDAFIEAYTSIKHIHAVQSIISIIAHVAHQEKDTDTLYALQKISLSLMQWG